MRNPGLLTIGVLALQGAFAKHAAVLRSLGCRVIEVRTPLELAECDGLVIPGGESTTMMKQMKFIGLVDPLKKFAASKPIFGTCAGLILMSSEILADSFQPLHVLDVSVERNAFGRQVESFKANVLAVLEQGKKEQLEAVFIRAPRIRSVGSNVTVLASYEEEPILIQQGFHLGASFHPELTHNSAVHAHFLKLVKKAKNQERR